MKRVWITTLVAALAVALAMGAIHSMSGGSRPMDGIKVGFIYENDESTPYTYNFYLAQSTLERELGDRIQTLTRSNVPDTQMEEPVRELVQAGCSILFVNNYSNQIVELAREYPQVQFCQGSFYDGEHENYPDNYHTFNVEIYQGRYISGIAAGMKLRDLIDTRAIAPEEALVGYVGAYPSTEVISGFTAFLLGVRSVCPEATMRVRYTKAWSSYSREKSCAAALIDEGCVIIAQHTDTIGPAVACEEASATRRVFHVGYNQNMIDIAPTTSLVSTRANWSPYILGAVEAVLAGESIEKRVGGNIHGNDACGGIDAGWVQMLELNRRIAAYGTQEAMDRAADALKRGALEVYKGEYTGVSPNDPEDTVDLRQGYEENEKGSWATFHYVLDDVITIEE